ncbi:MAG: hypothetical protein AB7F64_07450 [Gammaproteobacteria bacterium]
MTMLLFVNKPLTFVLYLLGVCLMVLFSFQDGNKFWFTCVWLIPAFSIFYFNAVTYHYLLRGNEKFEIKGVDIRAFKWPVRVYWLMSLIGLAISLVILFSGEHILFFSALFLVFYNAICAVVLKLVIYAKFFSLALKKNPTLKDFKIEDLYSDIREILLKKVIN